MKLALALVMVTAFGCKGDRPREAAAVRDGGAAIDAAAAMRADVADDVPATIDTPEALWAAYQALHVGATKADAPRIGQRIEALLSAEARDMLMQAVSETTAALPTTLSVKDAEVRHKLLGEGAVVRGAMMARARLTAVAPKGDGMLLTIVEGATTLQLVAVREGGAWRLGPAPDLLVAEDSLFALPAGAAQEVGATTPEAAAAAWVEANNGGTGWDAYNLVAPSNRAKLRAMAAQVGGTGDEDVVRILDKTLRDRRGRGITALAPTIEGSGDHRTVVFRYSAGRDDQFELVREADAWWVALPL